MLRWIGGISLRQKTRNEDVHKFMSIEKTQKDAQQQDSDGWDMH